MLRFKINKDKSDERFEFMECPIDDWMITIINAKEGNLYSVFAKKFIKNGWTQWYIELADHTSTNYKEARDMWQKLYEIILQYNHPSKWSEQ